MNLRAAIELLREFMAQDTMRLAPQLPQNRLVEGFWRAQDGQAISALLPVAGGGSILDFIGGCTPAALVRLTPPGCRRSMASITAASSYRKPDFSD